jgi:hypothetical protein
MRSRGERILSVLARLSGRQLQQPDGRRAYAARDERPSLLRGFNQAHLLVARHGEITETLRTLATVNESRTDDELKQLLLEFDSHVAGPFYNDLVPALSEIKQVLEQTGIGSWSLSADWLIGCRGSVADIRAAFEQLPKEPRRRSDLLATIVAHANHLQDGLSGESSPLRVLLQTLRTTTVQALQTQVGLALIGSDRPREIALAPWHQDLALLAPARVILTVMKQLLLNADDHSPPLSRIYVRGTVRRDGRYAVTVRNEKTKPESRGLVSANLRGTGLSGVRVQLAAVDGSLAIPDRDGLTHETVVTFHLVGAF